MSDLDTKVQRSQSRKRNFYAKLVRDHGEYKGAFSLKVINPKKQEYKREKIKKEYVHVNEEDD